MVWVLQTTATVSLCSDPAKKRLFLSQNPRSPTIGRFALNTEMDKVFNKLLQNMKMVLKRANKVALAAGENKFAFPAVSSYTYSLTVFKFIT